MTIGISIRQPTIPWIVVKAVFKFVLSSLKTATEKIHDWWHASYGLAHIVQANIVRLHPAVARYCVFTTLPCQACEVLYLSTRPD